METLLGRKKNTPKNKTIFKKFPNKYIYKLISDLLTIPFIKYLFVIVYFSAAKLSIFLQENL